MLFALHPNVYSTSAESKGLVHMLEHIWVRNSIPGKGHFFIVSGFANYNGGVRFYETIKHHIAYGGGCTAIFGGSTSQRLTSQQVVKELLMIGCEVYVINRKRLLHAKCYGYKYDQEQALVVSSGNFTGPGMSQNIEASLLVDGERIKEMGFEWEAFVGNILSQAWDIYKPELGNSADPTWNLLYDELGTAIRLDEDQEVTMVLTLNHADTVRIQSSKGTTQALGSQYFWLSKDSYDFFPALTIRNRRGDKATYSALVRMHYLDLGITDNACRVTFEAENNLDFRLGTGKLRHTGLAASGDLASITRIGEYEYELRIFKKDTQQFGTLLPHAVTFIGHQGKRFGYIPNDHFFKLINDQPHTSLI